MLVALLLAVALPTYGPVPEPPASAGLTAGMRLPAARGEALIVNSGSTNSTGYRLHVYDTGVVTVQQGDMPLRKTVPLGLVKRFFADLRAAGRLDALPQTGCMKSASFGSVTLVAYRKKTSPDLSCANSAAERALASDAAALADAAGVAMMRRPAPSL